MRKKIISYLVLAIICILPSACTDSDEGSSGKRFSETEYKIAVVLPLDASLDERWKRTAQWAMENLAIGQNDLDKRIKVSIEWYDENTVNLDSLAKALRGRDDIKCVIGPRTSGDVDIMANRLKSTKKTLISPSATSAEVMRSYAGMDFFWSLVESDITQCEVLLSMAVAYGNTDIALLANESTYGQTFIDWFAYQATEMGLNVTDIYTYSDDKANVNVRECARKAVRDENATMLICVPSDNDGIKAILEEKKAFDLTHELKEDEEPMSLYFADVALEPDVLKLGELSEFVEGTAPYADPESGFEISYRTRFGTNPACQEAQFYDALMISFLALTEIDLGTTDDMNEALKYVLAQEDDGKKRFSTNTWHSEGMYRAIHGMREGKERFDIAGATGQLNFDIEQQTSVIKSVYCHWMVYNGQFIALNFLSTDGSRRTSSAMASWEWKTSVMQDFYDNNSISYPERKDNWALLIAGSKTWTNYRHQADVLNMYQILKYLGYDDDHIILIMEDDIANNPENPNPGQLLRYDGINLYQNIDIDYKLSDITTDDIKSILTGKSSERLPRVVNGNENSNILVFWSGHGEKGALKLGDNSFEDCMTTSRMEDLLTSMHDGACYRKMLWLIETCYSASVAVAAQNLNIPGVMMITAASSLEPSKADVKIDGIWRTNRFTRILTGLIERDKSICFRDLYLYLAKYTTGSHVRVLNAMNFDNLYRSDIEEFIVPVK